MPHGHAGEKVIPALRPCKYALAAHVVTASTHSPPPTTAPTTAPAGPRVMPIAVAAAPTFQQIAAPPATPRATEDVSSAVRRTSTWSQRAPVLTVTALAGWSPITTAPMTS